MEDAYWRLEARLKAKTEMLEAYKKLDENMRNVRNRIVGEAKARSGLEDKNGELEAQVQDLRARLEVEHKARVTAEELCRKIESERHAPHIPFALTLIII
jgi:predicted nuclease with TOPRIM domain